MLEIFLIDEMNHICLLYILFTILNFFILNINKVNLIVNI